MKTLVIKKTNLIAKSIFIIVLILSQTKGNTQTGNPKYDKQLADSLDADEYGMKMYVLAILKPVTAKIEDKKTKDSLLYGHFQNIGRLIDIG